jgi:tRNA (guanine37-N1)-methyltransferase
MAGGAAGEGAVAGLPAVRIDILTLFPAICEGPLGESILKRAREKGLLDIRVHNIREWAAGKHLVTDDSPYGGGQGMVMKCEPIFAAVESIKAAAISAEAGAVPPIPRVLYLSPSGRRLSHALAAEYAGARGPLILLCGHYEGVDHRVIEHLVDEEISIGDYVLTNGAIAAAVFVDAVARLIPGVLGDENSAAQDSFSQGLLEGPQYTRPAEFRGWRVPDVLLSGNHAQIAQWRAEQGLEKTRQVRPDLLGGA